MCKGHNAERSVSAAGQSAVVDFFISRRGADARHDFGRKSPFFVEK